MHKLCAYDGEELKIMVSDRERMVKLRGILGIEK
jgi:hypothetical protein